jgi:hypothetical protein
LAKKHNVKVFFAVSPYFKIIPKYLFDPLKTIAKENNVPLLNHVSDSLFLKDASLFHDDLHLNLKGANIFSSIVAGDIKHYINN